eukprot:CAMPEP_0117420072 /NCGR_PEP_ID=MMETSP0758-20121206/1487_1 /TAXON_ID=63605 /ORGANISM="Percolomonas cosmopolitus, Strain AE-1 (ATCC 50343)" /LENGTH=604 /DNA_ID=CAMNT_0005201477 /DNA_START=167 /DNA_END=1981 /DNA_ORIENTATION=+
MKFSYKAQMKNEINEEIDMFRFLFENYDVFEFCTDDGFPSITRYNDIKMNMPSYEVRVKEEINHLLAIERNYQLQTELFRYLKHSKELGQIYEIPKVTGENEYAYYFPRKETVVANTKPVLSPTATPTKSPSKTKIVWKTTENAFTVSPEMHKVMNLDHCDLYTLQHASMTALLTIYCVVIPDVLEYHTTYSKKDVIDNGKRLAYVGIAKRGLSIEVVNIQKNVQAIVNHFYRCTDENVFTPYYKEPTNQSALELSLALAQIRQLGKQIQFGVVHVQENPSLSYEGKIIKELQFKRDKIIAKLSINNVEKGLFPHSMPRRVQHVDLMHHMNNDQLNRIDQESKNQDLSIDISSIMNRSHTPAKANELDTSLVTSFSPFDRAETPTKHTPTKKASLSVYKSRFGSDNKDNDAVNDLPISPAAQYLQKSKHHVSQSPTKALNFDDLDSSTTDLTSAPKLSSPMVDVYLYNCKKFKVKPNTRIKNTIATYNTLVHHEKIDFSDNFIGNRGIIPIMKCIGRMHDCQQLIIRQNGISNEGCAAICESVTKHPGIHTVDLSNNSLSIFAANGILAMVKANTNLRYVHLNGTAIPDDHLRWIENVLIPRRL